MISHNEAVKRKSADGTCLWKVRGAAARGPTENRSLVQTCLARFYPGQRPERNAQCSSDALASAECRRENGTVTSAGRSQPSAASPGKKKHTKKTQRTKNKTQTETDVKLQSPAGVKDKIFNHSWGQITAPSN